jgi:hypothetical protein
MIVGVAMAGWMGNVVTTVGGDNTAGLAAAAFIKP